MSKKSIKLEILEKMADLATAGLGLVAALAWNSAIQDLFGYLNLADGKNGLYPKFLYAVIITIIVVLVTYYLSRSTDRLKNELAKKDLAKEKEDEKK